MTALTRGTRLGPYELLVPLGKGGMATVWIGREIGRDSPRLFALKAILPELARDPDFRAMFLEEGQLVRAIHHENVVRVHEVGESRGILYMAMDWVEGDSLRALIREAQKRRPIPPEIAVKLIADAAAGLHAAHELRGWDGELRNLVHCDVSPHNILVGVDGRAKIADFGVANATHHASFGFEERIKGKAGYMSPEQAMGLPLDRRSDVFSLGSVLFELTTGERLFRGENAAHTLQLVRSSSIPDPRQILPSYPKRLALVTLRALARDPRERFESANELREALEQYLVDERIVVSQGSVAKLVRRVLGEQLSALRQSIETAEGASRANYYDDTGTPHPASLETSQKTPVRSVLPPLLSALGGISAAVASIVWVMQRPPSRDLVPSDTRAQSAVPIAPPTTQPLAPQPSPSGISVHNIPLGPPASSTPTLNPAPPKATPVPKRNTPIARESKATNAVPNKPLAAAPAPAAPAGALPVVLLDDAPPTAPADPAPIAPTAPPPAEEPSAPEQRQGFNRGAAVAALSAASKRASSCVLPNGVSGSGRASVTFFPDGRVAKVTLSAPFDGTPTGQCVANALRTARVPAFTGSAVTAPASFRVR